MQRSKRVLSESISSFACHDRTNDSLRLKQTLIAAVSFTAQDLLMESSVCLGLEAALSRMILLKHRRRDQHRLRVIVMQ